VIGPDDCREEGAIGERPAAAPSPTPKASMTASDR
jgi:hypothetical protein